MKKISVLLLIGLLLGCYRGYIALWEAGNTTPLAVYPYPLSILPPADQKLLAEGIPLRSEQELAQRLEDYLS